MSPNILHLIFIDFASKVPKKDIIRGWSLIVSNPFCLYSEENPHPSPDNL